MLVDCGIEALSVTVMVYVAVLEITVGVPAIAPVAAFRPKLKGNAGETAYFNAPVPPLPSKGLISVAGTPIV